MYYNTREGICTARKQINVQQNLENNIYARTKSSSGIKLHCQLYDNQMNSFAFFIEMKKNW